MTMNLNIARLFNEKGCGTAVGCPQKIKILFKTKLPIAEQILTYNKLYKIQSIGRLIFVEMSIIVQ